MLGGAAGLIILAGANKPGHQGTGADADPGTDRQYDALNDEGHAQGAEFDFAQPGDKQTVNKVEGSVKGKGDDGGDGQTQECF
ncbi:hypothetical protein ES703_64519 [subsurface metagenome]